ncbi:putative Rhomboid protease glpG [Cocos nucifera]|uniref:Putative Rhomboid protease glpG n=1 Tax=Cocos nucifera TaxID=13894 RepID=A0A8K0HTK6_COCNU|nr:putative Rhomboid protease glpG [Cocos nucifera]
MARDKELGILGILREALLSLLKNGKLVATIMLMIIPLNLLLTISKLNPPLVVDVTSIVSLLPSKFTISKSRQVEVRIWPLELIIPMFSMPVMVYLSVMTYTSRQLGLQELPSKIRRTCKGFLITMSYVKLVTLTYLMLFSMFGAFLQLFEVSSLVSFLILLMLFIMFIGSTVICVYLLIVGELSLVVSILEEGRHGVGALGRAGGLIRRRKLQGFFLMVVLMLLQRARSMVRGHWKRNYPKGTPMAADMVQNLLVMAAGFSFEVFCCLAFTVYYHECKRNSGRGKAAGEERMYNLLPFTSSVDAALP